MASQIDRVGAFRGYVLEHGVGATKNNFPQFTGRFSATQKWVDEKGEMEAFGITEPAWVDWSSYEQEMTGYLVLFGKDKDTGAPKPLFHLENCQKAFGWDGASFASLASMDLSQKLVTFWTEENEYNGTVSIRIGNIDDGEAPANRTLRILDAAGLQNLDQQFAGMLAGKKAPAVAAKAVAAPAKAGAAVPAKPAVPGKPATGAPAAAGKPATPAAGAAAKPASPSKPAVPAAAPKGPPKAPAAKPAAAPAADGEAPFAATMTMDEAWAYVTANKGAASDDAMAEKWIDASAAVAPGKDETTMTGEEWAGIAQATLKALAA